MSRFVSLFSILYSLSPDPADTLVDIKGVLAVRVTEASNMYPHPHSDLLICLVKNQRNHEMPRCSLVSFSCWKLSALFLFSLIPFFITFAGFELIKTLLHVYLFEASKLCLERGSDAGSSQEAKVITSNPRWARC